MLQSHRPIFPISYCLIGVVMQSFLYGGRWIQRWRKSLSLPHARYGEGIYVLKSTQYHAQQRREFAGIPAVLVPPVVFGGLVVTLWTWKCLMMVVFQNKIIYMPGLPPNARRERIHDYKCQCGGIEWREERIRSEDGTRISLGVASVTNGVKMSEPMKTVYILYFQGNASSIPPRLPFLSPVLRSLRDMPSEGQDPVRYTIVCCSYRGFWTSHGRPSERGIAMDAAAALRWIKNGSVPPGEDHEIPVIIWGQSIGAGVATSLAAQNQLFSGGLSLKSLILETPFISIRAMLETLYPQKWLPYKHLWPFLRNHLDSHQALGLMSERYIAAKTMAPNVLILEAGKDELVPKEHGAALEARCKELGLSVRKQTLDNSLHTEAMVRAGGRMAVVEAVSRVGKRWAITQG